MGRIMGDYLRGLLPDQTQVCPHMKSWSEAKLMTLVAMTVQQFGPPVTSAKMPVICDEAGKTLRRMALQLAEERQEITENLW